MIVLDVKEIVEKKRLQKAVDEIGGKWSVIFGFVIGYFSVIFTTFFLIRRTYTNLTLMPLGSTESRRLMSILSPTRCIQHLKNIGKPENIPVEYWNNILSVAIDLKKNVRESKKKSLKLLETKHVTLLFLRPHGRFQVAYSLACDMLAARKTFYRDLNFENHMYPGDSGKVKEISRALSRMTDMFITYGLHHDVLTKIVEDATVPVFSAGSELHCLQKALSDWMTFQERFNQLKGLTVAWIGPPNSLFNSYSVLCSKFDMNFRQTLICSFGAGEMSPARPSKLELDNELTLKRFKNPMESVQGAQIVATSAHPDEEYRLTMNILKTADPGWVLVHSLPRSWKEVSDDVFNNKKNLTWESSENYLYVAMAVVLTSLDESDPTCLNENRSPECPQAIFQD